MFKDFTKDVVKELAMLLGAVSHHLHPEIVLYLREANQNFKSEFQEYLHSKINERDFFFDGSDCVFPGVRRPINKETNSINWKNKIYLDGTILNDNTYPRHIWSFIVSGKAYSSSSWKSTGLNAFELAHIFGHKTDETELEQKSFLQFEKDKNPFALFTSASNVILIPKGLTKPTDKLEIIKLCYYKRHIELYGDKFYHMSGFKDELLPDWYKDISWIDPILPNNWKQNINKLLEYRSQHLRQKYTGVSLSMKPIIDINQNNQIISNSVSEVIEHISTRFFVDEKIYQRLLSNNLASFILKVNPIKGSHPKGVYIIPNNIIIHYIETKRAASNWKKYKTYHQDGIPKDLRNYFKPR